MGGKKILMWHPPEIKFGQLRNWLKMHNLEHQQVAEAMGLSVHTLRYHLTKHKDDDLIPRRMLCELASAAIFSGLPGLFDIKIVEIGIAVHLARGFRASLMPKSKRTIADANALGYASNLAEMILRTVDITRMPYRVCPAKSDPESGKESEDAAPDSATGS